MTKKNTRSCSHKRIKAALCAAMCSALTAMPAFATNGNNAAATTGTTVWTKASEIMQDVYKQIVAITMISPPRHSCCLCRRCPAADELFQERQDRG